MEETVGQRIKRLRQQRGMTQEEFGDSIGLAASTVACYETGVRNPKIETIQKFANGLDVPVEKLLSRTEEGYKHFSGGKYIEMKDHQPKVFYECDGKACKDGCTGRGCRHTADIEHAVNFEKIAGGAYQEIDEEERMERRKYTTEEMQEAVKKAAEEIGNKLREGFPITEGKNCDKSEGKYIYKICGEIYIDPEDMEDGVLDYIEMCVDKAVNGSAFDRISRSIYKYDNCAYIIITAGEAESLYLIAIELKERIGIEFEYGKVKLSPHQFES